MEFTFLGTSAGTPTKLRNVTGFALQEEFGRDWYLVDCGEGTQHQILRTKLSLNRLAGIFITHTHGDHCYGLPGLLASAGMSGRVAPLTIVAPDGIEAWIRATMQHVQLHLPFDVQFVATEVLGKWHCGSFQVEATELSHRVPSYAYSFTEIRTQSRLHHEKLIAHGITRGPLWGELKKGRNVEFEGRLLRSDDYLLLEDKPRKIVVGGDNDKPELLRDSCANCNALIHEATFTSDVPAKSGESYGHSSAKQVAIFAESAHIPNVFLTHFSARYQMHATDFPSVSDIRDEAAAYFSGNLFMAEDFAGYQLNKAGEIIPITAESPEGHLSSSR